MIRYRSPAALLAAGLPCPRRQPGPGGRSPGPAGRAHRQPGRGLFRPRQDHRPHHLVRRLYRRDGAVRRAPGDAARLLLAGPRPRRRSPTPSSRSTRSRSTARSAASSPAGCSPTAPASTPSTTPVYDVWLTDCSTSSSVAPPGQPVEVGLAGDRLLEQPLVVAPVDVDRAELLQVRGGELGVEEPEAAGPEPRRRDGRAPPSRHRARG